VGARCLRLGSIWCPPSIRLPGTGAYIGGESARESENQWDSNWDRKRESERERGEQNTKTQNDAEPANSICVNEWASFIGGVFV